MASLPLEGVKILDLSRQLPGPVATRLLADFGADVIKIEDVQKGDDFRSTEPKINGVAARHLELNRNKRGLSLNLKSDQGKEIFLRLAHQADVVLEQFRPGVVQRLGIDYEAVKAVNPKIVYCSLSGFGQDGPYRNLVAHDPNYLSLSGVLGLIGSRGGPPAMTGPQLADMAAANFVTIGILLALRNKEINGVGEYVDISLFDSAFSLPLTALTTYLASGQAPSRGSERHNGKYPWADIYATKDGQYVSVAAIEGHFYRNLCTALGREDWVDLQYADDTTQERIRSEMKKIFAGRTRDEWFFLMRDKDVCVAPVLSIEEAVASEQVLSRGNIVEHEHPVAGRMRLLTTPIRMTSGRPPIRCGAPDLGEHGAELLAGLGYSNQQINEFCAKGVLRIPEKS